MTVCILVPIKTTNERLPGKNTLLLKNKPLYAYLFETIKKTDNIDAVYIDSSDEKILQIARDWNFMPIKRPEEFNSNATTGDELIQRVIGELEYDVIGLLHVTTPFLSSETIRNAISRMSNPETDSVHGVLPRYNRFWFNDKPVNHDPMKLQRTQDLIPVCEETDFYFFKRKSFMKYKKRVCGNTVRIEVNATEALDIDTHLDFVLAEAIIDAGMIK